MQPGRARPFRRISKRVATAGFIAILLFTTMPGVVNAPIVHAGLSPGIVGVTAITARADATRSQQFDAIKSQGFKAVRLIVEWPIIEPAPGQYDWSSTDAIVFDAFAHNLTILGLITYAPAWAATPEGRNFLHPAPADPRVFADFSRMAAERYRGVINNWEIWNEPNIVQSFAPHPDVTLYSAMLSGAYSAIKGVDPTAVVISGGTSPAIDEAGSISPATFVNGLLDNGALFDGVGIHPYSSPSLISDQTQPWSSKVAIGQITDLLYCAGQGNKPLWFTEFGASTARTPETGQDDPSAQHVGVSEERQAEILVDGITYLRSLPNSGPIFVFDHRDYEEGGSTVQFHYGLIRYDFTPKPSLAAVQRLLGPA